LCYTDYIKKTMTTVVYLFFYSISDNPPLLQGVKFKVWSSF